MFQQLNLAVWSWIEALRAAGRGRLWLPFLFFFAFQLVLVVLLVSFAHPLLSWFLVPIYRMAYGAAATHYPMNLVVLGPIFAGSNLFIGVLGWALALATAMVLFVAVFQGGKGSTDDALRRGRIAYGKVLLTQIPLTIGIAFLAFGVPRFIESGESAMAVRLERYGTVLAGIILEALFVTAPLFVLVEGRRVGESLRRGLSFAVSNAPALLLLVGIPALLHLPLGFVNRRWRDIIEKGSPELLIVVVLADVLLYVLTNFLLVGGVTRYYLARRS